MPRTGLRIALKVAVIGGVLLVVALLVRDSSHHLRTVAYDASAPTASKLQPLTRWLPCDAELLAVIDPPRLFERPGVRARLAARARALQDMTGVDLALIKSLLTDSNAVGLIAAAFTLGLPDEPATGVLVVQGALDETAIVADVTDRLDAHHERLDRHVVDTTTVYGETSADAGYAFAFPDPRHMMLGPHKAVAELVGSPQECPALLNWMEPGTSAPLFGELHLSKRLHALLPSRISWVTEVRFTADQSLNATLTIPLKRTERVRDLSLFLEGMRVTYLFNRSPDDRWRELLKAVRIESNADRVVVHVPLHLLL